MKTRQADIARFFNGLSKDYYDQRYRCRQDINSFGMLNRMDCVISLLDKYAASGGKLVDLGCGPANIYEAIKARKFDYYGIDVSAGMIVEARKRLASVASPGHFALITGDVANTGFPNNYFDVALALGLIDYLDNESAFYQEVKRILRPGGLGILTYCNKVSYFHLVRSLLWPILKILGPSDRVLSTLRTKAHSASQEIKNLLRQNFEVLDLIFLGAYIVPFNLVMPQKYFYLIKRLEHLWQKYNFHFALSSFIIVIKKSPSNKHERSSS